MIIDVDNFTKKLTALLRYFHKPLDEPIKDVWFLVCNEALNDEEFNRAFELVIRKSDFLPPVDGFVKLVKGDRALKDEFESEEVWERLIELSAIATSTRPEHIEERKAYIKTLKPIYAHGLNKIGGLTSLGAVAPEDTHWRKRDFLTYVSKYRQVTEGREAEALTPPSMPSPTLPQGDRPELEINSLEWHLEAMNTAKSPRRSDGLGKISISDIDVGF
jgi:hypothetical protein